MMSLQGLPEAIELGTGCWPLTGERIWGPIMQGAGHVYRSSDSIRAVSRDGVGNIIFN